MATGMSALTTDAGCLHTGLHDRTASGLSSSPDESTSLDGAAAAAKMSGVGGEIGGAPFISLLQAFLGKSCFFF